MFVLIEVVAMFIAIVIYICNYVSRYEYNKKKLTGYMLVDSR